MWLVLLTVIAVTVSAAQDDIGAEPAVWQIAPTLSLGKYFPGSPVTGTSGDYWLSGGTMVYPTSSDFRYVAFTFGAGAHWFYGSDRRVTTPVILMSSDVGTVVNGIGELTRPGDFMVFPVTVGLQVTFPHDRRELIMVFAGIEGNLDFISGNVPTGQQAKAGYGLVAGFAVRIVEFGIRYTEFSDLRNLGAYFGFRLNPVNL
jgi:hypothetical protein